MLMFHYKIGHRKLAVEGSQSSLFCSMNHHQGYITGYISVSDRFLHLFCIGQFLFRVGWKRNRFHAVIKKLFQDAVGKNIGTGFVKYCFYICFCHQSSASGNIFYPFIQSFHFIVIGGTDQIKNLRMILYHIGRTAACISNSIVNPVSGLHVFSHVVYAYIHQLYGIQGASA
ncbi:unknown [Clostridium sp. CAG:299]|nr:unknown [Clostridium sp. CAG:299]